MSDRDGASDVAEFAALLTRLKERTDRSYGQLARRLHMNTSTLHRYCAGDAVPLDFAPVERFAALCGATAEERLELHRLWLPAVAARQRPRTPVPENEPAAEPEPESVPETRPEAEPGPVAKAEAEVEAEAEAEAEADPVTNLGAPPAPLPWYRRRRVLVTTAVAVASAATLAGLSALSNDRSSSTDAVQPTDPGRTSPTAPESPGPGTAKKPTATPPRASARPVARATASMGSPARTGTYLFTCSRT
ncbi:helix-turn-helix transcriptional regulator [Streptomyces sp. S3(2020)]|uniref:helix-turn-helix domain-containing protein n=1 Tax=Streptomyces sp. S3(2020) TaxID=2732044 RepID=UPI001F0E9CDE|nr:helix-turn-helix transcriptional regulator [Streptomyces sp. S3(2020)]